MAYLLTSAHARTLTRRQLSPSEQPVDQTCFQDEAPEEAYAPTEVIDGNESFDTRQLRVDAEAPSEPGRWRHLITYVVIAVLLVVFSLIVFWGLVQSVWWY